MYLDNIFVQHSEYKVLSRLVICKGDSSIVSAWAQGVMYVFDGKEQLMQHVVPICKNGREQVIVGRVTEICVRWKVTWISNSGSASVW